MALKHNISALLLSFFAFAPTWALTQEPGSERLEIQEVPPSVKASVESSHLQARQNTSEEDVEATLLLEEMSAREISTHSNARFVLDRYSEVSFESVRLSDDCGTYVLHSINLVSDSGHQSTAWQGLADTRDGAAYKTTLKLPRGLYQFQFEPQKTEGGCHHTIAVKETPGPLVYGDQVDGTWPSEAMGAEESLKLALVREARGTRLDIPSISVFTAPDFRNEISAPRTDTAWWLERLEEYCVRESRDALFNKRREFLEGLLGLGVDHSKPSTEKEMMNDLKIRVALERLGFASYRSSLGGEARQQKPYICDFEFESVFEFVRFTQSSAMPSVAVEVSTLPHLASPDSVIEEELFFNIAEKLEVEYSSLVLIYEGEEISYFSDAFVKGNPPILTSAFRQIRIDIDERTGRSNLISGTIGFLRPEIIRRAIRNLVGNRGKHTVLASSPTATRIELSSLKGGVIRGGVDWERVFVTVVQSNTNSGDLEISVVVDGLLASGLGSREPSHAAFNRSIDVVSPRALQNFTDRLAHLMSIEAKRH